MPDTGPLAAKLAEFSARNEDRIKHARYTEATVENHVAEGDVRRLLAGFTEILALAPDWEAAPVKDADESATAFAIRSVTTDARRQYGDAIRSAILAALTGKGAGDA